MELCLGTVQFGMNYGICGQKKPTREDAVRWIDYAVQNGISAIDTAEAYGDAEEVVGDFLSKHTVPRERVFLSTKLMPNVLDDCKSEDYYKVIKSHLEKRLKVLRTDYLDAYLFHSARYAFRPELLRALRKLQDDGLVIKSGVSVYEPEEADECLKNRDVTFIQIPYSVFDHRMKKSGVLRRAEGKTTEIHSRSAFLQGLILMKEEEIPSFLREARPIIQRIDAFSTEHGISRVALALAYVKREQAISHLVFGVDNLEQLQQNIAEFRKELPDDYLQELEEVFDDLKAEIVMPSLWKK